MSSTRRDVHPPSGATPPLSFQGAAGGPLDLGPPARELCRRYYEAFPDDIERYGDAGRAWCEHDSRYLLNWALEDAQSGLVDAVAQVRWLGRVLAAREFPRERLARHVELCAEVLEGAVPGALGRESARRMREAADAVRADEAQDVGGGEDGAADAGGPPST